MHVAAHAAHTVSVVGVHGALANDAASHTVHAPQVRPSPVKPGLHAHAAVPFMSKHIASGLQPPLPVAHTPC